MEYSSRPIPSHNADPNTSCIFTPITSTNATDEQQLLPYSYPDTPQRKIYVLEKCTPLLRPLLLDAHLHISDLFLCMLPDRLISRLLQIFPKHSIGLIPHSEHRLIEERRALWRYFGEEVRSRFMPHGDASFRRSMICVAYNDRIEVIRPMDGTETMMTSIFWLGNEMDEHYTMMARALQK